jgi:hypothetical protein
MTPHPALRLWLRGEFGIADSSRYGHGVTAAGSAAGAASGGKFGRCLTFPSGSGGDVLTVDYDATVRVAGASACTFACWVRPQATIAAITTFMAEVTSSAFNRLNLGTDASGNVRMTWRPSDQDPAGTQSVLTSSTVLASSTWCHLAAVFSTSARRLYVDGAEVASQVSNINALGTSTGNLFVGAQSLGGGQQLQCLMDEVMIFNNRALTIEDIRLIRQLSDPQRIAP